VSYRIVPYDRLYHSDFLYTEIRRCAEKFPYAVPGADARRTATWLAERARRATVENPRGCIVAVDEQEPDVALGILISPGPQELTWGYVKHPMRRARSRLGWRVGLGTAMAEAVGLDLSKPTFVGIWTMACSRMLASGYRLVPEIWEAR
jgi:hypothetical protein